MRDTLPNGATVEGTLDQINRIRSMMGYDRLFVDDGYHYKSSTKGVIRISDMDSRHIKNAVRKMYRTWVDSLDTNVSDREFAALLRAGPANITLLGLVKELTGRY